MIYLPQIIEAVEPASSRRNPRYTNSELFRTEFYRNLKLKGMEVRTKTE